jgi:hypothetical protein
MALLAGDREEAAYGLQMALLYRAFKTTKKIK